MNSFWNSNLNLFKERFPALAANLTLETSPDLILEEAKNGSMTAKSGSLMLHSKYNPEREADTLVESFDSSKHENAVFLGFGLGYGPAALAKKKSSGNHHTHRKGFKKIFFGTQCNGLDSDFQASENHPNS